MKRLSGLALAAAISVIPASVFAQSLAPAASGQLPPARYFSLQHRGPNAISAADAGVLMERRQDIAAEARFFGYDLAKGDWSYEQANCPAFDHTLLIHYIGKFPDGSESLFTALVPEGTGRVRVVPVLYRNAALYVPAVKNPRNYQVFNSFVSPGAAQDAMQGQGPWLALAACYAETVGDHANVPEPPPYELATLTVPRATIHLNSADRKTEVDFSDRQTERVVTEWSVTFNGKGQVIAASSQDYSAYVLHERPQKGPASQPMAEAAPPAEPTTTPMAPAAATETETQPMPVAAPGYTELPMPGYAKSAAPGSAEPPAPAAEAAAPTRAVESAAPAVKSAAPAPAWEPAMPTTYVGPSAPTRHEARQLPAVRATVVKITPNPPDPPVKFSPTPPDPPVTILPPPPMPQGMTITPDPQP
jgi:hypothetical protein